MSENDPYGSEGGARNERPYPYSGKNEGGRRWSFQGKQEVMPGTSEVFRVSGEVHMSYVKSSW